MQPCVCFTPRKSKSVGARCERSEKPPSNRSYPSAMIAAYIAVLGFASTPLHGVWPPGVSPPADVELIETRSTGSYPMVGLGSLHVPPVWVGTGLLRQAVLRALAVHGHRSEQQVLLRQAPRRLAAHRREPVLGGSSVASGWRHAHEGEGQRVLRQPRVRRGQLPAVQDGRNRGGVRCRGHEGREVRELLQLRRELGSDVAVLRLPAARLSLRGHQLFLLCRVRTDL